MPRKTRKPHKAAAAPGAQASEQPPEQPKWQKGIEAMAQYQFKPGQSGNPSGRPAEKPLTAQLKVLLAKYVPNDPKKRTYLELLVQRGVERAIKKSDPLFEHIWDRMEGRVGPDPESEDGARTTVVVVDVPRPNRVAVGKMDSIGPTITIPRPTRSTTGIRKAPEPPKPKEAKPADYDPRPPQ